MPKTKLKSSTKKEEKKYTLTIDLNGEILTVKTNDIRESLLSFKPDIVYTESYITIKGDGEIIERKLNLVQTRKLFMNDDFMEVFIINLMLK